MKGASEVIRKFAEERPKEIQSILLIALALRAAGDTIVTDKEVIQATDGKGLYMTIIDSGLRLEVLPAEEVEKRIKGSAEAGGNKPREERDETEKAKAP